MVSFLQLAAEKKTPFCDGFILNLKFEFPPNIVNNLFKFQAQGSDLVYCSEKLIALSEKKPPLGKSGLVLPVVN